MNVLPKPIRVTKMLTAQTLTVLLAVHARRDLLETAKRVKVSFFNFLVFDLYSKKLRYWKDNHYPRQNILY